MATDDLTNLTRKVEQLEAALGLVQDRQEIEILQNQYGYYLDNRMWQEMLEMFCDDEPSMEIGNRGTYIGKERLSRFLTEVLGQNRWGLMKEEIVNHIQLQMVITVSPDRQSAEGRCRALLQINYPPGNGKMVLAEGLYENDYVKVDGRWKLKRIWWSPTYYFQVAGFDQATFQSGPPSADFPPDRPSQPLDEALGRGYLPFHYKHPFTGAETPSPSGNPWRKPRF